MDRRTFDSPMDFEYNDRQAQVPADSPWMRGTKTLFQPNTFRNPTSKLQNRHRNNKLTNGGDNMAFQASSYPNTLPQTPIKNHVASFRDNPALDFSSGGENVSSPEMGDNEDTPDAVRLKRLNENVTVFRGEPSSPSKGSPTRNGRPQSPLKNARTSISNWVSNKFSPSQKSLVYKDRSRNAGAIARPPKRKRRALEEDIIEASESEYDSETMNLALTKQPNFSPRKTSRSTIKAPPTEIGTIPAVLKFIDEHPHLPQTLARWAQWLVSTIVMIGAVYVLYSFWSAIRRDIDLKADELSQDVLKQINLCTENFLAHGCTKRELLGSKFRILCDEWDTCMKQDHRAIGRAKISATTWAEILNGFVEPLSGKIIFLGVSLFALSMAFPHIIFGLMRKKGDDMFQHDGRNMSSGNYNSNPPFVAQEQYFTPMHPRHYDAFSGEGLTSGRRSPTKERRNLEGGSPVRGLHYR